MLVVHLSTTVGANARVHTNNGSSMGSQSVLNPSRQGWMCLHDQSLLISVHYKSSLSRSRFLDSALSQAVTPLVLIMACRIWFTHQQNNSSQSNLFLRAVQTSHLRPNRGSQNKQHGQKRTQHCVQNEKRCAELGRIVLQEVTSADSICKKFHPDSVLNFCDWHVCHVSVHDSCVSRLNESLPSFNVYLKKKNSDLVLQATTQNTLCSDVGK